MIDPPVTPAAEGTFDAGPGVKYTVGREHVTETLVGMMRKDRRFACDIETFGLGTDALRIKCVTLAHTDHAVVLDPRDPLQAHTIRKAFEHATELTFHNAVFDVPSLVRTGLMTIGQIEKVVDTLIFARLADPDEKSRKSLDACAKSLLGAVGDNLLTQVFRAQGLTKSQGFYKFDIDRMEYLAGAVTDGLITAELRPLVEAAALRQITENHPFTVWGVTGDEAQRLLWREQRINRMMLRRTCKGLRVDFEFLDEYQKRTAIEVREQATELEAAGIRPGYGPDLAAVLEEAGAMPADHPRTPKTGNYRMTARDVEGLAHPLAQIFVAHKRTVKVLDDYLQKVVDLADADGRIHPTTSVLAAWTGRSSMADPQLQQFPGPARGIILADEGDALTSIDWSQIEPVIMANIAGESKVLAGYESGTSDLYTDVAELAGGIPRKTAKVVLLAQLYGEGIAKLAADLGITPDEARSLKSAIFRALPRVRDLSQKLRNIGEGHRKVFTLSGRILPIPMGVWQGEVSVATHKAVNATVQGSAYDVLAEALIGLEEAGLGDAVYTGMHDEIVCSTDAANDIRKIMETPPERLCKLSGRVPVLRTDREDLGDRWNVS
jgi:DNA polymerase-1